MASLQIPNQRRLYELLEEQQEPFILQTSGLKIRRKGNILRSLLTRVKSFSLMKKEINWERLKLANGFPTAKIERNVAKFHGVSCNSSSLKEIHSPISVLELHSSDEGSSDNNHSIEEEFSSSFKNSTMVTMNITHTHVCPNEQNNSNLHQPRHILLDYLKEMEEKYCDPYEFIRQNKSGITMEKHVFPWKNEKENVPIFTYMSSSDLSETNAEWTQFQSEKRVISTEIGSIIFQEINEECVFDMLGIVYDNMEANYYGTRK